MATVKVIAAQNEVTRTLAFESVKVDGSNVTYVDLCKLPALIDLFNNATSEQQNIDPSEILASITHIGNTEIPEDEDFRNSMMNTPVKVNKDIVFDLFGNGEDEDEDEEEEDEQPQRSGNHVTVYPSGVAADPVNISIVVGQTTVHDAIYNDAVRGASGWSDDILAICSVMLNNVELSHDEIEDRTLKNGDSIVIFRKKPHTNGNC